MKRAVLMLLLLLTPISALAQDRLVQLYAPATLTQSGLLKHILPRFSLKTQVKVDLVLDPGTSTIVFGPEGRAIFEGAGAVWHMTLRAPDHPGTKRFADWLTSDVGLRTITGFAPDGAALFTPPPVRQTTRVAAVPRGDALRGHQLSREKCGRCHAVDEAGRKKGIGSTPSFFVLRSLGDWQERFTAFYVLNPHGSFTQVPDVTEPFPAERPPPIVPIEITLGELDAVLAYVADIAPADLGNPLIHQ